MADRESTRQLAHLWRRTGFGAPPEGQAGSYDDAVAALFAAQPTDPGVQHTPPPDLGPQPPRPTEASARKAYAAELRRQNNELLLWWLDRMVAAERAFDEKVTFFWHGHFATSTQKVRSPRFMLQQNATFRALGLGGFRTLARALVRDPALLLWLDGPSNRRRSPNENLGREFMELFTLGHGNYTDEDVKQAARALTGWRVDRAVGGARFVAGAHDDGAKTILGTTAAYDDRTLVDLLVAQPASARFVIGRIWTRFSSVSPPSAATLDQLTAAYGDGLNITALLRALFTSAEFRASGGQLVKQPVEIVVGALRAWGIRPASLDRPDQKALVGILQGMGQVPFRPPSVGGWPAGRAWLGTSAAASRVRLGSFLAAHGNLAAITSVRPADRPAAVGRLLSVEA